MTKVMKFSIDEIGRVCHEANRAYCIVVGDNVLVGWDELTEEYKESMRVGIMEVLKGNTPEMSHESWMKERLENGWKYGEKLNREAKIHPNLVPYNELPEKQKIKDHLFVNIVKALEIIE